MKNIYYIFTICCFFYLSRPMWSFTKNVFHSALTSALLITEPTPHPMTSVATIAAAAVPCNREVIYY